jgi:hypothetical protein
VLDNRRGKVLEHHPVVGSDSAGRGYRIPLQDRGCDGLMERQLLLRAGVVQPVRHRFGVHPAPVLKRQDSGMDALVHRCQVDIARGADHGGMENRVGGDPLRGVPGRVLETPERLKDRGGLSRCQFRSTGSGLPGAERLQPQPQLHQVAEGSLVEVEHEIDGCCHHRLRTPDDVRAGATADLYQPHQ